MYVANWVKSKTDKVTSCFHIECFKCDSVTKWIMKTFVNGQTKNKIKKKLWAVWIVNFLDGVGEKASLS